MPDPRQMFFEHPEDFFNRYSISLPANPAEAGKIGQMEIMQSKFKPIGGATQKTVQSFHKFKETKSGVLVNALAHNAAWKIDDQQRKATLIVRKASATLNEDTSQLKWFLCVMLPWMENGVASMTLRSATRANAFFTGAMNGCSFAVTGDPAEPFVSHINCADPSKYEEKYEEALSDSGQDTRNAMRLGREAYKLGQQHIGEQEEMVKKGLGTQKRELTGNIITDTLCFVMGRRVEGKWEFFYQRVITHQYRHVKSRGKFAKFFGTSEQAVQTIAYRSLTPYVKLWPDGAGRLTM